MFNIVGRSLHFWSWILGPRIRILGSILELRLWSVWCFPEFGVLPKSVLIFPFMFFVSYMTQIHASGLISLPRFLVTDCVPSSVPGIDSGSTATWMKPLQKMSKRMKVCPLKRLLEVKHSRVLVCFLKTFLPPEARQNHRINKRELLAVPADDVLYILCIHVAVHKYDWQSHFRIRVNSKKNGRPGIGPCDREHDRCAV